MTFGLNLIMILTNGHLGQLEKPYWRHFKGHNFWQITSEPKTIPWTEVNLSWAGIFMDASCISQKRKHKQFLYFFNYTTTFKKNQQRRRCIVNLLLSSIDCWMQ